MEMMAYYAFWSGVLASSVALAAGFIYVVFPRLAVRSAATNAGTMQVPVVVTSPEWLRGGSKSMSWLAVAVFSAYLGLRWSASGLPPVSNMWEYTVAFGWAMVIGSRVVDSLYRAWGLSLALLAGALVLFAVAEAAFSSRIGLIPAPHVQHLEAKHLLALHAGTMLVAFGAFGVAFVAAAAILIRQLGASSGWLPSKRTLEEITDRAVLLGFPAYTLGLAVGSFWMNSLWGNYWDWDTKAASALVAWLIYTAYLHARTLRRWRSVRAPLLVIIGFATVMFGYFGVNLLDYFGGNL